MRTKTNPGQVDSLTEVQKDAELQAQSTPPSEERQARSAPTYRALSARSVITTLRRHGPQSVSRLTGLLGGGEAVDRHVVSSILISLMADGLVVPMIRGRTASGLPLRVWRVAEPDEVVARSPL
jgi:hypothetical protein